MMLRSQIETLSEVPTYYYQYQVGGESLEQEQQRLCPSCGGQWFVGRQSTEFSILSVTNAELSLIFLGNLFSSRNLNSPFL